jgi:hypothetical protein
MVAGTAWQKAGSLPGTATREGWVVLAEPTLPQPAQQLPDLGRFRLSLPAEVHGPPDRGGGVR